MTSNPFFTIGHSTRPIDEFISILRGQEISFVVDVRTVPRSRTNPQYNQDVFPTSLAPFQIGYQHMASLGGLRGIQRNITPETNNFWENKSFHNYADYAMGMEFHLGLEKLREVGHTTRLVIMCAEAVWWRCHRRIISDYLITEGEQVFHIMGEGRLEEARLTSAARPQPSGSVIYPLIG